MPRRTNSNAGRRGEEIIDISAENSVNSSNSSNFFQNPKGFTFNYTENFNHVIELTTENFLNWKTNILYLLSINNLDSYIGEQRVKKLRKKDIRGNLNDYITDKFDTSLVYELGTPEKDIKNDILVKWIITNSLGENTKKILNSHNKTAYEIWKLLNDSFTMGEEHQKMILKDKLNKLKYNIEDDIHIFLSKFQNLIDDLERIDSDLSDNVKVGMLNRSLPENIRWVNVFQFNNDWKGCCNYLERIIPDIVFSKIRENTITENQQSIFNVTTIRNKNNNDQIKRNNKRKRKNGKCYLCGKFGHYQKECWRNKGNNNKRKNKYNNKSKNLNRKRNYKFNKKNTSKNHNYNINNINNYNNDIQEDFSTDYNTEKGFEINAAIVNNNNQFDIINNNNITCWILDSGASISMTNDLNQLTSIRKCKINISLPNGKEIIASHLGNFEGYINNHKFVLKNVYYSNQIYKNLISINQLILQNYKVIFNNFNNLPRATIYDNNGIRVCDIFSNLKNTFKVYFSKFPIIFNKKYSNTTNEINHTYLNKNQFMDLWHRRLGHFNISLIKDKLNKIIPPEKCEICINSKLKNKPYKKVKNKTSYTFELIHMDLVGPVTTSLNGYRYFLTILDDYSRFGWVIFITNKYETFEKFILWYNRIANIFNTKIKYIRTDNGKEFKNKNFEQFCQTNGIIQQFTVPFNPPQNGRSERLNGTIIYCAKSLLNESKLSHNFWEFAVDTANFIHNRLPHQGINNKIPYEILYNKPVNYNNFRVFGCRVYFFIPKEFRSKFDNNSHPGIFLGYSENTKAYKILDIINRKIILSRTVEFLENQPGNTYLHYSNNEFREADYTNNKFIKNLKHLEDNYTKYNNNYSNDNYKKYNNNYSNDKNTQSNNKNKTKNNNNNNENYTTQNSNYNKENNNIIENEKVNDNKVDSTKDKNSTINNNYNENNKNYNKNNNEIEINNNGKINNNLIENNSDINTPQFTINNTNYEHLLNHQLNKNFSLYSTPKRKSILNHNKSNKRFKCNKNTTINTINSIIDQSKEPINYNDIFKLKDKEEWLKAIQEELTNMEKLKVFDTIRKIPPNSNVISSRWVFKLKRDSEGNITKRKARLVAKGYTQKYGIDYKETFAPTLKQDTLRIFTAIAVNNNFKIKQIDINSAYLNAPLKENIYMKAPEGHYSFGKCYWKLKKALYGLKQAGKQWNDKLNEELLGMNFRRIKSEPCLYVKFDNNKNIICILSVYVDDILIAGKENEINNVKESIKERFNIKDIGNVEFVIGIKFEKVQNGYVLHQSRYVKDILNKYKINELTPLRNFTPRENEKLRKEKFNETIYRSAIGNLLYLAICTRPDILFGVTRAARQAHQPTLEDWENVLKIFRYLKGSINYGIKVEKNMNLKIFVDADYAGDPGSRKSTSGFLMMMGTTPTSWFSKLQHCVSTSTAEAEYYSLSECAKHALWYKNLLSELNINLKDITIFVDNKATIYNSENVSINPKSKHIDIRYHHIRDLVSKKIIKLKYIKSKDNIADGFTKYLNSTLMDNFRNSLLTKI